MLAVAIVSVLLTGMYAESYSESTSAFNKLEVYCATYIRIQHAFTAGPHQIPFTHYFVTFGINNSSPVGAGANWHVRALNQTWPDYATVGDEKSFPVARRSTSLVSFSIYVNQVNMIINPWDLEVTENYKISFFTFQRDLVPSVSLPACP
jgi:hypothetical protein